MYSHVEVVFITGYEEDWGSGKRKRKLKGARRRKRSKHFLISPLPSPLTLLFYSFSRPCFPRFIDWLHELKIKFELSDNSFFSIFAKEISLFFFFKICILMVINSLSAMLLAILCKNILWYENRKNEKRKGSKKERKEKNDCYSHFLQNIYDGCTTPQSKLSSW